MKHPDTNVAMQAVEFWSTVCEEEVNINKEIMLVSYILTNAKLVADSQFRPVITANFQSWSPKILQKLRFRRSCQSCLFS
jgi:hypothetical protein